VSIQQQLTVACIDVSGISRAVPTQHVLSKILASPNVLEKHDLCPWVCGYRKVREATNIA